MELSKIIEKNQTSINDVTGGDKQPEDIEDANEDFAAQLEHDGPIVKNADLDRACSDIKMDKSSMDEEEIHKNLEDYDLKNYRGMTDELKKHEEFEKKALELGIDERLLIE